MPADIPEPAEPGMTDAEHDGRTISLGPSATRDVVGPSTTAWFNDEVRDVEYDRWKRERGGDAYRETESDLARLRELAEADDLHRSDVAEIVKALPWLLDTIEAQQAQITAWAVRWQEQFDRAERLEGDRTLLQGCKDGAEARVERLKTERDQLRLTNGASAVGFINVIQKLETTERRLATLIEAVRAIAGRMWEAHRGVGAPGDLPPRHVDDLFNACDLAEQEGADG